MLGPLGRPFEVDPRSRHLLLIAGGLGHGRGPDARRRGGPRRPPGHDPVRGAEREPRLSVQPAARRSGVRRGHGRRLARPSRLRDRAACPTTRPGPTRPSPAARTRCWRGWRGWPPAGASGSAWPSWGARGAPARPIRSVRPRPAARPSCRSRWSRRWAAPSAPAWAASVIGVDGPLRVCREGPVFAAEEIAWPASA